MFDLILLIAITLLILVMLLAELLLWIAAIWALCHLSWMSGIAYVAIAFFINFVRGVCIEVSKPIVDAIDAPRGNT